MTHRPCIAPPPPRDTVECPPDLAFGDESESGVRTVIDPERAATMRAEWAAAATDPAPSWESILDAETDHATAYPGSLYR